jgi:predicted small lipoprotein YifL
LNKKKMQKNSNVLPCGNSFSVSEVPEATECSNVKKSLSPFLFIIGIALLTGCGKKGSLYLENQVPPPSSTSSSSAKSKPDQSQTGTQTNSPNTAVSH